MGGCTNITGLSAWINRTQSSIQAKSVRSLNLLHAPDKEIFLAAKAARAVILTKDQDFYQLITQLGPPPQIIWLTCGNTSTRYLCELLKKALPLTMDLLRKGEPIVEIT